ncbi:MAG: RIP metalloprotease RseP [Ignavibacteriales bacterium]|nr:RIP metalloprotease RseP [Ignavibacteriales bacterium]
MTVLTTIFYFVITIGILVFIHELGHFLAAKFFGMRVDRFSIGFPPRAFGKKIGETDYCVSWIPIGGYVKIAGMIDESFDTDFVGQEPQPWEFRAKPIWQRMIVISAGVIMNILLAIFIFWGIIYYQGKLTRPITEIGYVVPESPAAKAGLKSGDKIISVNSHDVTRWEEIESIIYAEALGNDLTLEIQRRNESITTFIARSDLPDISDERFGILPAGLLAVVQRVESGMPAEHVGLQPGDTIKTVNKEPVVYAGLQETIRSNAGKEILIGWKRSENLLEAKVTPTTEGRIGIALDAVYTGPVEHVEYSLIGAFPEGVKEVWIASAFFVNNIYQLIVGRASFTRSVGGPIKIAQIATRSAESGVMTFLGFMALLSMSLALLNVLPFPALDGGHLLFLTYEGVFRREIPHKVKIAIQQAGVFLLLVFMAFVLYNDIATF